MSTARDILRVLSWMSLAFFAAQALMYMWFTLIAWRELGALRRARIYAPLDEIFASPFAPRVSLLLPAYNEEAGIVASATSLLDLRYPRHEVIVVNDGSTDTTLEVLDAAFDLMPVHGALRTRIPCKPIRGMYVSRRRRNLWVLDKENGGKSDALNAGINAASHPYYCAIDGDAILEHESLLRIVKPVIDDPDVFVAAAGLVRPANGATIAGGQMLEFRLPHSRLAVMQVVEYFRSFLIGRTGWGEIGALLIVPGAFGLFRRSVVEEVGGYRTDTVGEDMELVVRLHRRMREQDEEYRIAFVPEPTCWTEAPEAVRVLSRQRRRWQRGLGETLWHHRRMLFNPRYGIVGLCAMPFFLVFEFLSPAIQLGGFVFVGIAFAYDAVSIPFMVLFAVVSILVWLLLSFAALLLEEFTVLHYPRAADIARLTLCSMVEAIGYRQLVSVFGCMGIVDLARRRKDWGAMPRRGLERQADAAAEPPLSRRA